MELKEILEHNENVLKEREEVGKQLEELQKKFDALTKLVIAPCKFCPYDGVYRCEACIETGYAGFNEPNFLTGRGD